MNWYIAKIIFQIKGNGMQKPQFDEHLRLIEAENFEEAFLKARILGIRSEDSVVNKNHGPVKWEFVNVAELPFQDRKSTRLNSSHQIISYAVFCLKKKKNKFHV